MEKWAGRPTLAECVITIVLFNKNCHQFIQLVDKFRVDGGICACTAQAVHVALSDLNFLCHVPGQYGHVSQFKCC